MPIIYSLVLVHVSVYMCIAADLFGHRHPQGKVTSGQITEASGLAASRVFPGVLYTHNDKGDSSHFFAVDIKTGQQLATFELRNAQNYDWEDIAYGPCVDDCNQNTSCNGDAPPPRYCIYIADIGDHHSDGPKDNIYMVREPAVIADSTIDVVDMLEFSWTEFDAETLMISPDGRLFVISKVHGGRGIMAQLPDYSVWGQGRISLDMSNAATLKITTTHNDPQGGDISPDGKEMLLVAEEGAYYISVPDGDYLNAIRTTVPTEITTYIPERSTEAIAWSPDQKGFYVLAEGAGETIFFYPAVTGPAVG